MKKYLLIILLGLQSYCSFGMENVSPERHQTLALLLQAPEQCKAMKERTAQFSPDYKKTTTGGSEVMGRFKVGIALSNQNQVAQDMAKRFELDEKALLSILDSKIVTYHLK